MRDLLPIPNCLNPCRSVCERLMLASSSEKELEIVRPVAQPQIPTP